MTRDDAVHEDDRAIEALNRLGLSTYEAAVFVALQKLETGTASEIAEVSDVPRSQVYGTAEDLAERGLLEVQQGKPTRYRAVEVEAARKQLIASLRSTGDAAFDYLQSVRADLADDEATREAIWTVQGQANVTARCESLIDAGTEEILFATEPASLDESTLAALADAKDRSVEVTVASVAESVLEEARTVLGPEHVRRVPPAMNLDIATGRVLLVDDATILMSVPPSDVLPHLQGETGFWSRDTGFATLLVAILRAWFGMATDDPAGNGDASAGLQ